MKPLEIIVKYSAVFPEYFPIPLSHTVHFGGSVEFIVVVVVVIPVAFGFFSSSLILHSYMCIVYAYSLYIAAPLMIFN